MLRGTNWPLGPTYFEDLKRANCPQAIPLSSTIEGDLPLSSIHSLFIRHLLCARPRSSQFLEVAFPLYLVLKKALD